MAIVGSAHMVVRALTDRVDSDIRRGFSGSNLSGSNAAAAKAGRNIGNIFANGFRNSNSTTMLGKLTDAFVGLRAATEPTYNAFRSFMRMNYTVGTAVQVLIVSIFSLLGGLTALASSAIGAAGSLIVLANGGFALASGMIAAKIALGGVGKALSALNRQSGSAANNAKQIQQAEQNLALTIERNRESLIDANNSVRDAQIALNKALADGREEIQQIGFEAEDAALSEKKAALELNKARETLARVQDLPPNSRARKEAELAFEEADLNLRKAKDRNADLTKEQDRLARTGVSGTDAVISATKRLADAEAEKSRVIRDGIRAQIAAQQALDDALAGMASGGSDPFAGLTASQAEFVRNLQTLKPLLAELRESVAKAFLEPLWEAISLLADRAFPTIRDGLTVVAGAMGNASVSLAQAIVETKNLENLTKVFQSSAVIIEGLGRTLGSVWGAGLAVLVAASPLAERFVKHLETVTAQFDTWAKSDIGQAKMTNFFKLSGDAAAQFGKILGNTFAGIGGYVMANLGPGTGGQYLLDWLQSATKKFRDLDSDAAKATGLKEYFLGAAINTQKMLSSVGALLAELIKLGDNKAIGETFDILAKGAPAIGIIAKEAIEAGPALAEVVALIAQTLSLLASSTQIEYFFLPLKIALEAIKSFLEQAWVQAVLKALDPIIGFLAGVGALTALLAILGKVLIFVAARALAPLIAMFGSFMAMPVLAVLVGLAAAFIYLYKTSEDFRNSFQNAFAGVSAALADVGVRVSEVTKLVVGPMGDAFGKLLGVVGTLLVALMQLVSSFVSSLAPIIGEIVSIFVLIVPPIIDVFSTIVTMIIPILNQLTGMFTMAFGGIADGVFGQISPIVKTITTVLESFASIFAWVLSAVNTLLVAFTPVISQLVGFVTEFISTLLSGINQIIGPLTSALTAIFSQMGPIIQGLMGMVGGYLNALLPMVIGIVTTIFDVMSQVLSAVTPLIYTVMDALTQIITMLAPIISTVFGMIAGLITQVIGIIAPLITQIINIIVPIVETLIGALMPALETVFGIIGPLLQTIFDAITPLLGLVGEMAGLFVQTFGTILTNLIGALVPLLQPIASLFGAIVAAITPLITVITDVVGSLMSTLIPVLLTIVDSFFGVVVGVINALMPVIEQIVPIIGEVIGQVATFVGELITALAPVISVIAELIQNVVVALMPFIQVLITTLIPIIKQVFDAFLPLISSILPPLSSMITMLAGAFIDLVTALMPVITTMLDQLLPVFTDLLERVAPMLSSIISFVAQTFTLLLQTLMPLIQIIIESVIPIFMALVEAIVPLIKPLMDFLIPLLDVIIQLFMSLMPPIMSIIGVFVSLLLPIVSVLIMIFKMLFTVLTPIIEVFIMIVGTILQFIMPAIQVFIQILTVIIGVITMVTQAIMTGIVAGLNFLIGVIQTVVKFINWFGDMFRIGFNAIVDIARGVVNIVIGIIEGMINFIIDAINFFTSGVRGAIEAIASLMGVKIKVGGIGHVNLPRLAKGGVVNPSPGGTMAVIGEAGRPERVEPLDPDGLSKRDKAMIKLLAGGTGGNITINVQAAPGMNEAELASAVSREISFQMRRGAVA